MGKRTTRQPCPQKVQKKAFFPIGDGPPLADLVAEAKRVCAGCPVRALCLADAMATEDPSLRWGVVGGLSPAERNRVFSERRDQVDKPDSGRAVA